MTTDKSNLSLKKVEIESAQLFCEKSEQETFFTNPKYICNLDKKIDWWIVSKGEEKICLWPIFTSPENNVDVPLFSYYFGPVWSNSFLNSSNHSKLSKRNKVLEIFIKKFIIKYKNLVSHFHYSDHDMRFFNWWNYTNQRKFIITPKYSSVIENLHKKSEDEILLGFRELRRRMFKKAKKNKDIVSDQTFEYEEILSLYKETIKRKNQEIEEGVPEKIKIFYDLCKKDFCKMIGYRNKSNGKLISIILLAFANRTSNMILNLSAYDWKESGITALNMFSAIKYSKEKKFANFDFNGANSPIGADDKQSYGGAYKLYFEVQLNNK